MDLPHNRFIASPVCLLGRVMIVVVTLGVAVLPTARASLMDVTSPTTTWTGIKYGGSNGFDPTVDQQTGSAEGDIVGSAQHASVYTYFADANTPSTTDGMLGFRIRLGEDSSPAGFKTAAFVGIITNAASGKIDLFVGVNNSGSADAIGIFWPGSGANTSPSTTTISGAMISYTETALNYNWSPVNTTIDPSVGTATDLDGGGGNDYFLTFAVPFSDIVAQLAARGITGINENSTFSYVIATSTQGNSLNQDLNGVPKNYNGALSWGALGALADPTTPISAVPEGNAATFVSVLLAAVVAHQHFRISRKRRREATNDGRRLR